MPLSATAMNTYTILLVVPLICAPHSCVLIDGEMSFDVQIIKDNSDRRHNMFTEIEEEKRNKEEKDPLFERNGMLIKERETDQPTANKEIKEDKQRVEEEGRHNVVTGKLIERNRYTTEEKEVDGKGRIDQAESSQKMMTRAVHLECVYQYPERKQMEALLSDMMNQLTRLIVSAHEYSESDVGIVTNMNDGGNVGNKSDLGNMDNISDVGNMGNISDVGNMGNISDVGDVGNTTEVHNVGNASDAGDADDKDDVGTADSVSDAAGAGGGRGGRRREKRFRVVSARGPAGFEGVFKQLSQQYQKFYNTTLQTINRSADPCEHQPEIKKTWRELLARSQDMLRRSALSAARLLLPRSRADARRKALDALLARELPRARSELLETLCEGFQLCYNDLL